VAEIPDSRERFPQVIGDAPHPATIPIERLLQDCELRTQPRSGPGGQHRNRTSSGAFLHHLPSGIIGEATERRSQAQNRNIVVQRLRFRLAVHLRTASILDQPADVIEAALRELYAGHPLRINDQNKDKPSVLAMLLNDLHASGGQPSLVAKHWSVSTSRVVAFAKSHPAAFTLVNQIRRHHGRPPLK
jgi:hypothetical protein